MKQKLAGANLLRHAGHLWPFNPNPFFRTANFHGIQYVHIQNSFPVNGPVRNLPWNPFLFPACQQLLHTALFQNTDWFSVKRIVQSISRIIPGMHLNSPDTAVQHGLL